VLITWHDLEAEARNAEEASRQKENAKAQARQREERVKRALQETRAEVEDARWGTPEVAFETWKSRTDTLIEMANDLASEFTCESQQAMELHYCDTFSVYGWKRRPGLLWNQVATDFYIPHF